MTVARLVRHWVIRSARRREEKTAIVDVNVFGVARAAGGVLIITGVEAVFDMFVDFGGLMI